MITQRESRTTAWETTKSLCRETRTTHHKDSTHHNDHSSSSSPRNTVCVLTDHQPVNHQETERSEISEITDSVIVNAIKPKEQCTQNIISVSQDQRAQTNISILNKTDIEVEIHSEEIGAQHVVHFRDAQDRSDAGSLITRCQHGYQQLNRASHGTSQRGSRTHQ